MMLAITFLGSNMHSAGGAVRDPAPPILRKEQTMADAELKTLKTPDETRGFERGKIEVVNIGGGTVGRATFEPGWKWSEHVKPIAKTELCQAPHFFYQISGRMGVKMADGHEFECGPGDVAVIPPGHDAWVVGNDAVVMIDWSGAANYAKA
jgi:quercetin dioxygenase-like cupin family protein